MFLFFLPIRVITCIWRHLSLTLNHLHNIGHLGIHQILIIVIIILIFCSRETTQLCYNVSEQKILTFVNNNASRMTHLPTVRFIQGYWPTQWATQYVAKVFLEERMGLNTVFFPSLASGLGLGDLTEYRYPDFYFDYLVDDSYDMILENWPTREVNENGYYGTGKVMNGGNSLVYGDIGFYCPEYVFDEHPEYLLLHNLKYDEAIRKTFVDAYTVHSDRNWFEFFQNKVNTDSVFLNAYLSEQFELPMAPNETTMPIVWGSTLYFVMSSDAHGILSNVNIYDPSTESMDAGLDWQYVPMGAEADLSEMIIDLYEKKLPFIATIYSPHTDFSTVSNRTGEYMKFQKIVFKRNTDNSVLSDCFIDYQCDYPVSPLYKMGNGRLFDRFPELAQFVLSFHLLGTDINDMSATHVELTRDYPSMSDQDKWLLSTCEWLQTNEAAVADWYQEIVRYDCSDFDGCGFDAYYTDSSLKESVTIDNGGEIGGYCVNSSIGAQCMCTNELLGGDSCRTHCAGLSIYRQSYSSSSSSSTTTDLSSNTSTTTVVVEYEYVFQQCSGHGTCESAHFQCTCEAGYGGDACDITYHEFVYSTPLTVFWTALLSLIIVVNLASVAWMYRERSYKTIRVIGIRMTVLYTTGMVLVCLAPIVFIYRPLTDALCITQNYCVGIGAVLTVMCPLLKAYRINAIFNSKRMRIKKIPDAKLSMYLLVTMFIEMLVCTIYAVLHQVSGGVRTVYSAELYRIENECNTTEAVTYLWNANYLYIFALTVILAYFSFRNHKPHIGEVFQDLKCAYFGSFFSLFVFIVILIFFLVTDDTVVKISIYCGGICIATLVVWVLFWPGKIYRFYAEPEKRNELKLMPATSTHTRDMSYTGSTANLGVGGGGRFSVGGGSVGGRGSVGGGGGRSLDKNRFKSQKTIDEEFARQKSSSLEPEREPERREREREQQHIEMQMPATPVIVVNDSRAGHGNSGASNSVDSVDSTSPMTPANRVDGNPGTPDTPYLD